MIEWGNPNWGKPGLNVHYASDGSWVKSGQDFDTHSGEVEES